MQSCAYFASRKPLSNLEKSINVFRVLTTYKCVMNGNSGLFLANLVDRFSVTDALQLLRNNREDFFGR